MNIEVNKRYYHIANKDKDGVYQVNVNATRYYYEVKINGTYFDYDSVEELRENIINDLENAKKEVNKQLTKRK